MSKCIFCGSDGGEVLWRNEHLRIVLAPEPLFPGFCRVIWNHHVAEMTDLSDFERTLLMEVVFIVEEGLRSLLKPTKVNLASLGNVVPHVHWHVIPRFADDSHFPQPVWGPQQRDVAPRNFSESFIMDLKNYLASRLNK